MKKFDFILIFYGILLALVICFVSTQMTSCASKCTEDSHIAKRWYVDNGYQLQDYWWGTRWEKIDEKN